MVIKNDKPVQPLPPPRKANAPSKPATAAVKARAVFGDEMSTGRTNALRRSAMFGGPAAFTPAAVTAADAVTPPSCRALNPASVAQANADYDQYKNFGAGTTRVMIELLKEHQNDPDYCAQLIARAKDPNDGVLDYLTGGLNGAFMKDSGGGYVMGFDESDRNAITSAVRAALDAGTITEQEIRDRAANSPGMADLAQRLGLSQAGVTQGSVNASEQLRQVKGDYDAAHAAVLEKEQRLAQELAAMGPAMTDAQRAKYIQAFRNDPSNAEAYQKEAAAAKALADTLETNKAAMLDAAARDPAVRQQLYESLEALADSGQAKTALGFAVEIQKDPSSPLAQAFASQFPNFDDDITAKALPGAAAQLMAEGADPASALAQLKAMVGPLANAWKMKSGAQELGKAWKAIDDAAAGRYDGLANLAKEWDGKSGPMKALAGLAVVFGAVSATTQAAQGNYLAAVKGFAQTGEKGLELLAGATKSLADAGKLAQFGEQGLKFASFAERLAPGLGLIANATAFVLDAQNAAKDGGNAGYAIAVLGDALGVLGSALELFPPSAPVGAIFNAIGAIVSGAGTLLGTVIDGNKFKEEQRRLLEAAGVKEPLLGALLSADPEQVKQLRDFGFTPEQIQVLATKYPQLLETSHGFGPNLENLKALQQRLGLTSAQLYGLLDQGDGAALQQLMYVLGHPNFFPEVANAQSVGGLVNQLLALSPEQAATLSKAIDYLLSIDRPYNGPH